MDAEGENPQKEVAENSETEEEDSPPCCSPAAYKRCCCTWNIYWKALVWLTIVVAYLLFGGLIFAAAERPNELMEIQLASTTRDTARTNITNMLIDLTSCNDAVCMEEIESVVDNISELVSAFQEIPSEANPIWEYGPAVYFASTVITTIGYGVLAPATAQGQVLFIFYALIGIPISLTFLSILGEILSGFINRPIARFIARRKKRGAKINVALVRLFVALSALVCGLILFIFIPALIFTAIEPWSYGEAVYFCFVTLTTVGFGDFVPAQGTATSDTSTSLRGLYTVATAVWTWIGLAFVSLLITEIQNLSRAVGKSVTQCLRRWKHRKSGRAEIELHGDHTPRDKSPYAGGEN